jgi:hypothetical protein
VKRIALLLVLAACGDNDVPVTYQNPSGGQLRLVKNPASGGTTVVLDFIVGNMPLVGYSTGFDLPLAPGDATLTQFTPGSVLDPGPAPIAALASIPTEGPLANNLVTAQSQKATAAASDAMLAPGAVLFTVQLEITPGASPGIVFDGTAKDFTLPSGGLRDKAGDTVVDPTNVAIGKLEIHRL